MMYNALRRVGALRKLYARLPIPFIKGMWLMRTRLFKGYSDADPLKLLWIDPAQIRYTEHRRGQVRIGIVMDGEWDRTRKLLVEVDRYASIQKLYVGALRSGRRNDIDHDLSPHILRKTDMILNSILNLGYRTQQELLNIDKQSARLLNNDTAHPVFNEIGVNIHRDGVLVRSGGGFHRLAVATALGIDAVPVIVRARHAHWQAIRREVAKAPGVSALSTEALGHLYHPDLDDIIPPSWRSRAHPMGRGEFPVTSAV
jgi:hypothetical protein